MMTPCGRLLREAWEVRPIPLKECRALVEAFHYTKGGANTGTYCHGLFIKGDPTPLGAAWWFPPTTGAARATLPGNWKGVLSLSRLVLVPYLPTNSASFLLSGSRKLIDRVRWPVLVTYADTWRGHTGAIYKADNWSYEGLTTPEPTFVLNGRVVARRAGHRTHTRADLEAMGARYVGSFAKHKFVHRRAA